MPTVSSAPPRTPALRGGPAGRRRRIVAGACLLATGIVVGTGLGMLLAVLAVIVLLDAVVPMPGGARTQADAHFEAAVAARRRAARHGAPPLEVLDDGAGWAATARRRALGVEEVPLATITGTVEPVKARDFDRDFRPDASVAGPWKAVWMAHAAGTALEPIAVYRVAGRHVVRDGHHRVSVARELGMTSIDAEVVELTPV